MKSLYRYIFLFVVTLFIVAFSSECIDAAERECRSSHSAPANEYLSLSLPETLLACPVGEITVPIHQNVCNTGCNLMLKRLHTSLKFFCSAQWSGRGGMFCQGALFRQHELSSPFYCTPPSRYYVYALRRLII